MGSFRPGAGIPFHTRKGVNKHNNAQSIHREFVHSKLSDPTYRTAAHHGGGTVQDSHLTSLTIVCCSYENVF